jgi:uncharacterized protein YbaR (Trm112 family)
MTKERFEISCPGCNQQYEVDDTRLGTELACHGCGETFVISDEMLQTIDADLPDEMHHEKVEDDSEPITENKKSKKTGRSWVLKIGVVLCFAVQCVILFYVKEHNEMNAEIGNKITKLEIKLRSVSSDVFTISLNTRELPKTRFPVDPFRIPVTTEDIASQLDSVQSELSILSGELSILSSSMRSIEQKITLETLFGN